MASSTTIKTITSVWAAHLAGPSSAHIENASEHFPVYFSIQPTAAPPAASDIGHFLAPREVKPTKPIVVGSSLFIRHNGTSEGADQEVILTDEV
jgi:hypothetical protein